MSGDSHGDVPTTYVVLYVMHSAHFSCYCNSLSGNYFVYAAIPCYGVAHRRMLAVTCRLGRVREKGLPLYPCPGSWL